MATLASFTTIDSGIPFFVFNTHYDERGLQARTESSKLVIEHVNELVAKSSTTSSPPLIFLVGDLNSPDSEDGYRALTGWRYVSDQAKPISYQSHVGGKVTFLDARHELHTRVAGVNAARLLGGRYGDWLATFTGFGENDHRNVIDVVLIADTGALAAVHRGRNARKEGAEQQTMHSATQTQWIVSRYGVIPNRFEGRFLVSDHRMVVATVRQSIMGMPE